MSKYTMEVRYICETYAGLDESVGFNDIDTVLDNSREKIFDFYYPFYDLSDPNRKKEFEKLILRHYYTREICEETVGRWKLRLQQKLNEIMPYYNMLYKSALLEFNPFYDTDLNTIENGSTTDKNTENKNTVDNERVDELNNRDRVNKNGKKTDTEFNNNTNENGDSVGNDENLNLYSDTPQGGINGMDLGRNNMYLTNATKNLDNNAKNYRTNRDEDGENHVTENGNESENISDFRNKLNNRNMNENSDKTGESLTQYAKKVIGKRAGNSYSYMLMEFRKTFINIDQLVLNELSDLFFGLWE